MIHMKIKKMIFEIRKAYNQKILTKLIYQKSNGEIVCRFVYIRKMYEHYFIGYDIKARKNKRFNVNSILSISTNWEEKK